MFRANRAIRYANDQETLRLNRIQLQKTAVLEIAAQFIESPRTEEDKQKAFDQLEQCRAIIMALFPPATIRSQI